MQITVQQAMMVTITKVHVAEFTLLCCRVLGLFFSLSLILMTVCTYSELAKALPALKVLASCEESSRKIFFKMLYHFSLGLIQMRVTKRFQTSHEQFALFRQQSQFDSKAYPGDHTWEVVVSGVGFSESGSTCFSVSRVHSLEPNVISFMRWRSRSF